MGGQARAQTVAFPRYAPFTGTDASGFKLGGNARLTAGGTSPADAANNGVLRLTNAVGTQAGYAIDNSVFATPNGFSVSFEFFAYGSTSTAPADGFSVFLVDGAGTDPSANPTQFTIGATGGSLGYAQKTNIPGASKGYLGIGIDEFGNYSNASEGRIGGPGVRANAVALRGPYDPTDASKGYSYLTGTGSLAFNLAAGGSTRITDPTAAGYRKAYINVIPVGSGSNLTYRITVRIQNGQNLVTTVNNFTVTNPPATLRVGFAASTGGSNSVHEIRALQIVQAPIANDDQVLTKYNASVAINVLANDQVASGAPAIDPATVDLDPTTVAIDNTYTVAGQGTFTVSSSGVVTFAPVGTFSGVVSVPYTVNNVNGNISNPANITVTVTGADVASAVSGPATASPGSTITYTVTTTDNGRESATNVIPTLQLASGLVLVSASLPAGATYNSTSGVVTFAQTTLAAGASAMNAVQVTVPAAAATNTAYASTANYTYPSGQVVPDAVAGNNEASITTKVGGLANVATVCATPGKDGPVTLNSSSTLPNTYYPGVTATAGDHTLTVGTTSTGSTTAIAADDLLLIVQMQGAAIDATNTATYGTASAITAGQYEYAVAAGAVSSSGTLALVGALGRTYTNADPSASVAQQRFQVIRVPQYSVLTVGGAVRGLAWNNTTGGVLALDVAGQTTFSSGTLNMNGAGFRGGASAAASGNTTDASAYVANNSTVYARKGESIAGQPRIVYNGTGTVDLGTGYASTGGSSARGAPANGGGGGNYGAGTGINAGGGGGANGGAGSTGAFNTGANGGVGGQVVSTPTVSQLYLGGGGGAGTTTSTTPTQASGGVGGGLIVLNSGTVSGTATITANGSAGLSDGAASVAGGGGGGAGGTVVLTANSGLGGLTVQANGGAGGATNYGGGGGGGGVVYSSGALASAASVAVGAGGTGGTGGAAAIDAPTSGARGTTCVPALSATLQAATPQVTRVGTSSVRPATYVLTVSNTGGGLSGLRTTAALATNSAQLFTYGTTTAAVLTYADGTTKTLVADTDYTAPTANSTSPVFALTSLNVPAGASVAFTFTVNIANAAANNTAYASNATVNYLSPTRTTAAGTTAGTAYTSAGGTSPDVVTIVAPLPVELTNFVATAVGADALLSWRTAQEVNNHHFEVERSVDGRAFQKIGALPGHGTVSSASDYRYADAGAAALGGVLYYRLRQVDNDGAWSLTQPVAVRFRRAANAAVALFPNPTTGRVTLDLTSLPAGTYAVQVLDLTGRVVQHYQYQPGPQPLDVQSLATGTYFVRVQGGAVNAMLPLLRQ
ncbi:MAG: T9SS type A sorting domain-containing protein [Janthinobacterium lividum]